jgi:hypothetical protein
MLAFVNSKSLVERVLINESWQTDFRSPMSLSQYTIQLSIEGSDGGGCILKLTEILGLILRELMVSKLT